MAPEQQSWLRARLSADLSEAGYALLEEASVPEGLAWLREVSSAEAYISTTQARTDYFDGVGELLFSVLERTHVRDGRQGHCFFYRENQTWSFDLGKVNWVEPPRQDADQQEQP